MKNKNFYERLFIYILIKYSKKLEFTQEPDYCYLKNLLMKVAQKNGIDIDKAKYDWDINRKRRKTKTKNFRTSKS